MTWLFVNVGLWWLGFMACRLDAEVEEIRCKYGWGYLQLGAQMVLAWARCEEAAG